MLAQLIRLTVVNLLLSTMSFANAETEKEPSLLLLTDDGPPHMIQATKSGIDLDITLAVLAKMKKKVQVEFAPLKRSMVSVANKQADIFLPTFFQKDQNNLYISDAIIQYRPTLFSLKNAALSIKQLTDINSLNVSTFQGATGYFGDEFIAMTKQNVYREYHDMSILPKLLLTKRTDVVVLDYYIFYYFLQQHLNDENTANDRSLNIERHDIIPQVNAYVGFNDIQLRDEFNQALKLFLATNQQQQIIKRYIQDNSQNNSQNN